MKSYKVVSKLTSPIHHGQVFAYLQVLCEVNKTDKHRMYSCRCRCGSTVNVQLGHLRSGHTKSCGCLRIQSATKHGASRSAEYVSWNRMLQRCCNQNRRDWMHYGGRGIKVCLSWEKSFQCFLADMGPKPGGAE